MADPNETGDIVLGTDLVTDYVFEPNGLLSEQKIYMGTSATVASTTFSYDPIGRRILTTDPENNREKIYYHTDPALGSQVVKTEQYENDPDGNEDFTITTFMLYDTNGRLSARILDENGDGDIDATDPNTSFTYDGLGRLTHTTAPDGIVTFTAYDGFGNVKQTIEDYGTGTENRKTEFVYNRLNQQWKILAYDPNDTTQDVDVQVTEYTFDKNGNVTQITYPDDKSATYLYNLLNKVDTEIQRDGTEIYYWYDQTGNLRYESDDPDGPDSTQTPTLLTEFQYDAAGNLTYAWKGIDLEEVSESSFTYNGFGAKTSETVCYDGDFTQTTTWTYDGSGNRLTQTHGNNVLTTTYDGLNRIKTLNRGNDRIVSYAYMGKNTKSISYPEPDVVQSFVYDDLGRVEQVRSAEGADQTILDFIYTYDEVGNRKQCQYNHLSPVVYDKYYYDTLNRLWKVEYAQTSGFALNTEGDSLPMDVLVLVASAWLNNDAADFAAYMDSITIAGKTMPALDITIANPVVLSEHLDRIKQAVMQAGFKDVDQFLKSVKSVTRIALNPDEKIYSLSVLDTTSKKYRSETLYDDEGTIIARIIWDNKDRMVLFAMYPDCGGTVVVSTTYDSEGNIISNTFTTLDEDGTIIYTVETTAQTKTLASVKSSTLLLTSDSAILTSSTPEALTSKIDEYKYDHLGNRTTVYLNKGVMAQETHVYAHNRVNQYSTINSSIIGLPFEATMEYDNNGNVMTDKNGNAYFYDYRNRLIEVQDPNSDTIVEYSFDALGRRISKTVDSVTTYFFYDPQGRVIAEYEGTTPILTREFVYGNGFNEVLAMFTPYHVGDPDDWDDFVELVEAWLCVDPNDACYNGTYDHNNDDIVNFEDFDYFAGIWDIPSNQESNWYYLYDALGSVRGIVGGRFNRESDREFYNYDVYGKLSIQDGEESKSGNPILFASYRFDAEIGLYHTDNRTYDPETGRWLQIDPIDYADSWNLYEYAISSPTNYIDPFGLSSCNDGKLDSFQRSIKSMNCPECPPAEFAPEPSEGRKGDWGWKQAWRHYLSGRTLAGTVWGDNILSTPALSLLTGWTKFKPATDADPRVQGYRQFGKPVEFSHESKYAHWLSTGTNIGLNFWTKFRQSIISDAHSRAVSLSENKCTGFSIRGNNQDKILDYGITAGRDMWNDSGTLANGQSNSYSQIDYSGKCCLKRNCDTATLKCRIRFDLRDLFTWDSNYYLHQLGKDYWQIVHFDRFIETDIDINK
jgi:RHS repeat-associated protein